MTDDLLAAQADLDELRAAARAVLRVGVGDHGRDSLREGNCPGHSHTRPGVWDPDNRPALAGKACEVCAAWQRLWRLAGDEL